MKVILQDNRRYILRFDKDEEVIAGIVSFAEEHHVTAASFQGLGASRQVVLAYYDLQEKKYNDHELSEDMEIVSLTGNIAQMDEKPLIHAHGVFSDSTLKTSGGHVKKLIVSATCEIFLIKLEGEINRIYDETTGLNLLS